MKKEAREKFTAFPFYDIDTNYYVVATIEQSKTSKIFKMKTSTDRKPKYRVFGTVTFTIKDTVYKLNVYQNLGLLKNPEYEDYLFLPFNDYTNGNETYGGGRYLDVIIPKGNTMVWILIKLTILIVLTLMVILALFLQEEIVWKQRLMLGLSLKK